MMNRKDQFDGVCCFEARVAPWNR